MKVINSDAIQFLEWYRRNNVIYQFHAYHIPNMSDKSWQETVFLGNRSYLGAHELYNIFLKGNE